MARPKEFDKDQALGAAIGVFGEHGFAGTSATMLTDAMGIGRQSLYDTFGDKWQLYCLAVERYAASETQAHFAALRSGPRAIDGIRRMLERVVAEAHQPCLGVGSISEFGKEQADLVQIHAAAGIPLRGAMAARIRAAQQEGGMKAALDADHAAGFLIANIAGIRLAARGGAGDDELRALAQMALQALE